MASRFSKTILTSLTTAAMAIPGIADSFANGKVPSAAPPKGAVAKNWYDGATLDVKYTRYVEDGPNVVVPLASPSHFGRYDIDVWQAHIVVPADDFRYTVDLQRDAQTGSSQKIVVPAGAVGGDPTKIGALRTGATIDDDRNEIKFRTEYFTGNDKYDLTLYYSSENDLVSPAISAMGQWGFNKNNTILQFGAGFTYEKSTPTKPNWFSDNPRPKGEYNIQKYFLGVRQDLSKYNYVFLSTEFQYQQGDLELPYPQVFIAGNARAFVGSALIGYAPVPFGPILPDGITIVSDKRPHHRSIWMPMIRFVQYVPWTDASLHFQYRFGADNWDMRSHTFELQYFQPMPGDWQIQPLVRYYSQSAVDFIGPLYNIGAAVPFPTIPFTNKGWTGDWRLGTYGTLNLELKIGWQALSFMNIGLTGGWYKAKPQWSLSHRDKIENPALTRKKGFGAHYISGNLNFKL